MTLARRLRRMAAVTLSALLVVIAMTACSTVQRARPHGERLDVGASGITWFGPDDTVRARALYSTNGVKVAAFLTRALGTPQSVVRRKLNKQFVSIETHWLGLNLRYGSGKIAKDSFEVEVDASRVNGIPIFALDRYRVDGPFPTDGAEPTCSMSAYPFSIAGIFASLNPPRLNVFTRKHSPNVVGIFENSEHHQTLGAFEAPTAIQLC